MKNFKNTLGMLKYNIWTLVGFEALFKVLSFVIFTPLFLKSFTLVMHITGFNYLTLDNIMEFLSKPSTMAMLLLIIILMTIYTMFDITTVIIILDESYHKRKIKMVEAVRRSLKKVFRVLIPTNIVLPFMVLFLIPFLNLGVASSFVSTIKVPEFIMDFITNNYFFLSILIVVIIGLTWLFLRWIYTLHYFVLEDLSFFRACKKSINLGKKHHFSDIVIILLVQFLAFIIYFIFIILGILGIIYLNQICKVIWLKSFISTLIWVFIAISFIVMTSLATPLSYAAISSLYYYRKNKINEEIINKEIVNDNRDIHMNKKLKKAIGLIIVLGILGGTTFTYGLYKGHFNLNIEYARTIEVTAHRGSSKYYPENTMPAFIEAKNEGAEFIEIDVQETRDGEVIVIHDTNFSRTCGVDKNTWELDLNEVKELDAGSFKDAKFKETKIPTLEEVIVFAKENNMKLNIEIKPTGHEKNLEQNVINLVNQYDFKDEAIVASQDYKVLEKVKYIDSSINTLYVMSIAIGDITEFRYADGFSLEASNINTYLVKKVHKSGKKLHVWTINSEDNINKMIDLKVDNIITDDVVLTKSMVMQSKTSDLISEYIKVIESVF